MSTISNWKVWVAAGALFFAGIFLGVVGTTFVGIRLFRHAVRDTLAGKPGPGGDRLINRLADRIARDNDLTPEQASTVRSVLVETGAHLRAKRRDTVREAQEEIRQAIQRISESLPPEKRTAFQAHAAERLGRLGLSLEPAP